MNKYEVYMNEEGDMVFWNPLYEQYLYYSSRWDTTAVVTDLEKYLENDNWVPLTRVLDTPKKRGRPAKSTKE